MSGCGEPAIMCRHAGLDPASKATDATLVGGDGLEPPTRSV